MQLQACSDVLASSDVLVLPKVKTVRGRGAAFIVRIFRMVAAGITAKRNDAPHALP
jgi:hypothetical protein